MCVIKEREFYLTPDQHGCGHKAADTAKSSERSMSVCLPAAGKGVGDVCKRFIANARPVPVWDFRGCTANGRYHS